MVNVNRLRGKMVENGITVEDVARATKRNKATIYRKLKSNGDSFTIAEIMRLIELLKLTEPEQIMNIFFD